MQLVSCTVLQPLFYNNLPLFKAFGHPDQDFTKKTFNLSKKITHEINLVDPMVPSISAPLSGHHTFCQPFLLSSGPFISPLPAHGPDVCVALDRLFVLRGRPRPIHKRKPLISCLAILADEPKNRPLIVNGCICMVCTEKF